MVLKKGEQGNGSLKWRIKWRKESRIENSNYEVADSVHEVEMIPYYNPYCIPYTPLCSQFTILPEDRVSKEESRNQRSSGKAGSNCVTNEITSS